jgi:hypothetical protein
MKIKVVILDENLGDIIGYVAFPLRKYEMEKINFQ